MNSNCQTVLTYRNFVADFLQVSCQTVGLLNAVESLWTFLHTIEHSWTIWT